MPASLGASNNVVKPVRWDTFKHVMDRFSPPEGDVLIVEDDADTRARIREVLELDGRSVIEADNGQYSLDCWATGPGFAGVTRRRARGSGSERR